MCRVILEVLRQHPHADTTDITGNNLLHYCISNYNPSVSFFDMVHPESLFQQILAKTQDSSKKILFNQRNGDGRNSYKLLLHHNPKNGSARKFMNQFIDWTEIFVRYLDPEELRLTDIENYTNRFLKSLTKCPKEISHSDCQMLYTKYLSLISIVKLRILKPIRDKKGTLSKLNNYVIHIVLEYLDFEPSYELALKK